MLNDRLGGLTCRLPRWLPISPLPVQAPEWEAPPPCVDAVFFDLCGVLYDDTPWRHWLLQLLSRMGLHTHYVAFFRVWDCEFRDDVAWGRVTFWQAMRTFLRSAGLSPGQTDEVAAAGRARIREFERDIHPFPYVRGALTELAARGIHLGVSSSLPLTDEQLAARLTALHLNDLLQIRVTARDWPRGAARDPRVRQLLAAAEVPATQAAYVGRLREELEAAARVGLHTIAFNPEPDATSALCLEQYSQLPRLIRSSAKPMLAAG